MTPFELPKIVLDPYRKEEILVLLRERCSRHEMPTAKSQRPARKPEYCQNPRSVSMIEWDGFWDSGKYCLAMNEFSFDYGDTHAYLKLSQVAVLVNLETEEVWCRMQPDGPWLVWDDTQVVPIHPKDLEDEIEIYL